MNQLFFTQQYNLKTGDRLIRAKGPLSTHHGIYVGIYNGLPMVAENQIGHGVRYVSLETFMSGNPLREIRRFSGTQEQRQAIIPRINRLLGKSYDLLNFNCEHFAELIQNNRTHSRQVNNALMGVALLVALFSIR